MLRAHEFTGCYDVTEDALSALPSRFFPNQSGRIQRMGKGSSVSRVGVTHWLVSPSAVSTREQTNQLA